MKSYFTSGFLFVFFILYIKYRLGSRLYAQNEAEALFFDQSIKWSKH